MNISNFKRKSVACLLVISFFFTLFATYPKRVDALIPSIDPSSAGLLVKEMVLDPIVWVLVKLLAKALVASMTKWVDSGFDGAPLFATDPAGFLTGVGDNVFGDFISSSGFGALCSPFRVQVQGAITARYVGSKVGSRDPYQASCRLSTITGNVQQFFDGDFTQGGWPAWLALTQDPQGNPYSAVIDAEAQASIRITGEKSIEIGKLNWASGFISFSDCVRYAGGEQGGVDEDGNPIPPDPETPRKCVERGPTKTPGNVIAEKLNLNLGSDIRSLEVSDEISELLGALLDQVIGEVFKGAKGLFSNSGSGTDTGTPGGGTINPGFPTTLTVVPQGPNPQQVITHTPYLEYGAYATDPVDGIIPASSITVSGTVDIDTDGTYIITYTATNSAGQTAQATRDVIVSSQTGPPPSRQTLGVTCTVLPPYSVPLGSPYTPIVMWKATISGGSGTFAQIKLDGDENPIAHGPSDGREAWIPLWPFPPAPTSPFSVYMTQAGGVTTVYGPRFYSDTGNKSASIRVIDTDGTVRAVTASCSDTVFVY